MLVGQDGNRRSGRYTRDSAPSDYDIVRTPYEVLQIIIVQCLDLLASSNAGLHHDRPNVVSRFNSVA